MALFEITLTNVGPLPWIDLLATVVLLGSYLGVAYITYATQGIYSAQYFSLSSFCFHIFKKPPFFFWL
jgi:hypothetical protein